MAAPDEALLATILDHPDDDAPRLIYADWLEEHGQQERGELIRVQCERARLDEDDERQRALILREGALLKAHGAAWLGKLKPLAKEYRYERGFVSWVSVPGRTFLNKGAKLFTFAPIRGVQLTHLGMGKFPAAELAAVPELGKLRLLQLRGALNDPLTHTVLQSPHLRDLQGLHLEDSNLGTETIEHLWEGQLPRLTALELHGERLPIYAEELCRPRIPLREYAVTSIQGVFHRDRVQELARDKPLAKLTHLNLRNSPVQVPGATALAGAKVLANLRILNLRNTSIGVTGAQAIGNSKHLANLTTLNVRTNHFGINGLRGLVESPRLTKLTRVDLGNNDLDARAVPVLRAWPCLKQLRALDLADNQIPDAAMAELLQAPELASLWHLDLGGNPLGKLSGQLLCDAPHLQNLCNLRVTNTDIGPLWRDLRQRFGDRVEV